MRNWVIKPRIEVDEWKVRKRFGSWCVVEVKSLYWLRRKKLRRIPLSLTYIKFESEGLAWEYIENG